MYFKIARSSKEEKLSREMVYKVLIDRLPRDFARLGLHPSSIAVFRDGRLCTPDRLGLEDVAAKLIRDRLVAGDFEFSVVEVHKNSAYQPRIFWEQNGKTFNSDMGSYREIGTKEAILCTTGNPLLSRAFDPAEEVQDMILGYKASVGASDAYHYGKIDGGDRKFIRVVCGLAMPIHDRERGSTAIVGEIYRPSGPPSFVALAGYSGDWADVTNSLSQWRRDLKFTHVVVDREEARRLIWTMKGLNYAINEIPLVSYVAPFWSTTEVGRSVVDELIKETRFSLPDDVRAGLSNEPSKGQLAIRLAIAWMRDYQAYYSPMRERQRGPARLLGMEGLD